MIWRLLALSCLCLLMVDAEWEAELHGVVGADTDDEYDHLLQDDHISSEDVWMDALEEEEDDGAEPEWRDALGITPCTTNTTLFDVDGIDSRAELKATVRDLNISVNGPSPDIPLPVAFRAIASMVDKALLEPEGSFSKWMAPMLHGDEGVNEFVNLELGDTKKMIKSKNC